MPAADATLRIRGDTRHAQAALGSLHASASTVGSSLGGASGSAKTLQERVEKLATSVTGTSSVLGGMGSTVGATAGAVSNAMQAFAAGGPVLLAGSLAATALSFTYSKITDTSGEAKESVSSLIDDAIKPFEEAAKEAARHSQSMADRLTDLNVDGLSETTRALEVLAQSNEQFAEKNAEIERLEQDNDVARRQRLALIKAQQDLFRGSIKLSAEDQQALAGTKRALESEIDLRKARAIELSAEAGKLRNEAIPAQEEVLARARRLESALERERKKREAIRRLRRTSEREARDARERARGVRDAEFDAETGQMTFLARTRQEAAEHGAAVAAEGARKSTDARLAAIKAWEEKFKAVNENIERHEDETERRRLKKKAKATRERIALEKKAAREAIRAQEEIKRKAADTARERAEIAIAFSQVAIDASFSVIEAVIEGDALAAASAVLAAARQTGAMVFGYGAQAFAAGMSKNALVAGSGADGVAIGLGLMAAGAAIGGTATAGSAAMGRLTGASGSGSTSASNRGPGGETFLGNGNTTGRLQQGGDGNVTIVYQNEVIGDSTEMSKRIAKHLGRGNRKLLFA